MLNGIGKTKDVVGNGVTIGEQESSYGRPGLWIDPPGGSNIILGITRGKNADEELYIAETLGDMQLLYDEYHSNYTYGFSIYHGRVDQSVVKVPVDIQAMTEMIAKHIMPDEVKQTIFFFAGGNTIALAILFKLCFDFKSADQVYSLVSDILHNKRSVNGLKILHEPYKPQP